MRFLCINAKKKAQRELAEVFLQLGPHISFRNQICGGSDTSLFFIQIDKQVLNEFYFLKTARKLAKKIFPNCTLAISDTPYGAQVFSTSYELFVCPPEKEKQLLESQPIQKLLHLEGVTPWEDTKKIQQIISLCQIMQTQTIKPLYRISEFQMRKRWGKVGLNLWKKLHQKEQQKIISLNPTPFLQSLVQLQKPIFLKSFLNYEIDRCLLPLCMRLKGRKENMNTITFYLKGRLESYSFQISLCTDNKLSVDFDERALTKRVEQELSLLHFKTPITSFQIQVSDHCSQKTKLSSPQPLSLPQPIFHLQNKTLLAKIHHRIVRVLEPSQT